MTVRTAISKATWSKKKLPTEIPGNLISGTHILPKIALNQIKKPGILEGWWHTGRNIRKIWAEWAVHISCYLQKAWFFHLVIHIPRMVICHINIIQ